MRHGNTLLVHRSFLKGFGTGDNEGTKEELVRRVHCLLELKALYKTQHAKSKDLSVACCCRKGTLFNCFPTFPSIVGQALEPPYKEVSKQFYGQDCSELLEEASVESPVRCPLVAIHEPCLICGGV